MAPTHCPPPPYALSRHQLRIDESPPGHVNSSRILGNSEHSKLVWPHLSKEKVSGISQNPVSKLAKSICHRAWNIG